MEQQYLWIIHQNKSRGMSEADAVAAADKWALDTIMARKKREATIKKYAPPQLTPNQMVRAAQKSMGNIPGGLLSEEGPGQMAPPSLLEGAYVNKIPSQQDMWKSQAHSMSPNYLAQDSESVELPSHHAIHGGGYPIPPPQSAETLSSIHERGFIPFSGESIPFDHPSIAGESIPVTMAMHEQMIPGLHKYFGGGHPDEISLTQAPQHYGYDQFSRPKGLLDTPTPTKQVSEIPGDELLREETGWNRDRRFPNWMSLVNQGMEIYGG